MRHALFAILAGLACQAGPPSSVLLTNAKGENQDLASIGRVRARFTCSGALIQPGGAGPSSPAYVLTAGHCISLEPYGVIQDQAAAYTVEFNYFQDTRDKLISVKAPRVVWSTMKGVDLALLELDATLGELNTRGLTAHPLASSAPRLGQPVFWAGMPSSFLPPGETYARRGECAAKGTTDLIEARWTWFEQIRHDCPDVYAGASGSPLFDAQTRGIVGVIGTSTNLSLTGGPDFDCYQNRPCAVTRDGPVVESETSYASPVAGLAGCFAAGRFDVTLPACGLDHGYQATVDPGRTNALPPVSNGQRARWNIRLGGDAAYYAWKQLPLGRGDCRDPAGYSAPVETAVKPLIDAEFAEAREGEYLMCVVAGPAAAIGANWQPFRFPTVVRRTLDATPLQALPQYDLQHTGLAYRLSLLEQAPATQIARTKRGPLGQVNCADPQGYALMISVPPVIFPRDYPHRICVQLGDEAGNLSPPMQFDFGPPALPPFPFHNGASLRRTAAVARGGLFALDGMELTATPGFARLPAAELGGLRLEITDARGVKHRAGLTTAWWNLVEGYLPRDAALGPARVELYTPRAAAPLITSVEIVEVEPGFFTATFAGFGPALGYQIAPDGSPLPLFTCNAAGVSGCAERPIVLDPARPTDLMIHGTGMLNAPLTARLGTEPVEVVTVEPNPDWPGLDSIRIRLPARFPLRGYQYLWLGSYFHYVRIQ